MVTWHFKFGQFELTIQILWKKLRALSQKVIYIWKNKNALVDLTNKVMIVKK